jgi:hypothetical protein
MMLGQADSPPLERQLNRLHLQPPVWAEALLTARAAEDERARVGRVGQEVVHGAVAGGRPADAPLPHRPARQPLPLGDQLGDDLAGGAEPLPVREDAPDGGAHLLVGREHDPAVFVAVEPDRQTERELAPLGLVTQAAIQPSADQVQLRLGHRPLEPEQEPVVEVTRRVDAVLVGDQRPGQGAEVEQPVPVGRGAGEPRHLERKDDPDLAQPHRGRELLEADPPLARGPRNGRCPRRPRPPPRAASRARPPAPPAHTGAPATRRCARPGRASTGAHRQPLAANAAAR